MSLSAQSIHRLYAWTLFALGSSKEHTADTEDRKDYYSIACDLADGPHVWVERVREGRLLVTPAVKADVTTMQITLGDPNTGRMGPTLLDIDVNIALDPGDVAEILRKAEEAGFVDLEIPDVPPPDLQDPITNEGDDDE